MNKLGYLLKIQLMSIFGINKMIHEQDERKKRKAVGMGILLAFAGVMCILMSVTYNYGILVALTLLKLQSFYMPLVVVVTSFIIFFTSLYKVNGVLFGFKDYDRIMTLPIKTSTIVASRIILLYLLNFAFLCVVMIPAGIIYGLMIPTTFYFWVKYLIAFFFIPLIPIIAGAVLGSIITSIISRFKKSSLIGTLLYILFICGFMVFSFTGNQKMIDTFTDANLVDQLLQKFIGRTYPLAILYGKGVCDNNIGAFLIFIGLSLLGFIIFVSVLGTKFKAIHTALTSTRMRKSYQLGRLRGNTPLMALYKKEVRRYFSSTIYVVNTSIGSIFLLLFTGSLCFVDLKRMEMLLEMPGLSGYVSQFAPLVVSGFLVLTTTTASSISLEGKNLWILQSLPVPVKTIFLSKLMVQCVIAVPAILIGGTILIVVLPTTFIESITILILPLIYNLFLGILGLICNLKYPKLEWNNEVEVIKQSMATIINMIGGMLSLLILIGGVVIMKGLENQTKMVIITLVMGLITLLAYNYLNTKGVEAFKKIKA